MSDPDSIRDINVALAEALGINTEGVYGVNLRLRPDRLPQIVIIRHLVNAAWAQPVRSVVEKYELRPERTK